MRSTSVGLYLGDETDEVLLPNKYVPENYTIGEPLRVFVYLDSTERIIATTLEPYIALNKFSNLKIVHISDDGAFADIGLEKNLFIPYAQMGSPMRLNQYYIIHCFLDAMTNRLIGSSKTNKFLSNQNLTVKRFDEVDILVSHISDIGVNVIVNDMHKGLIYHSDLYEPLEVGDRRKAVVKLIRPENKLDISLQAIGFKNIEPNADFILKKLKENKGFLALHDNSAPDKIYDELKMSKKNFKKAIGSLYKQKLISLEKEGIKLIEKI